MVLSGGSGTRLWPLSTPDLPKQFAPILDGESLFERTLLRLHGRSWVDAPVVVTGHRQVELVRRAAARARVGLGLVIIEPEGRNTAPAVIAAALASDPGVVLVILPSDHLISDGSGFAGAVNLAAKAASAAQIVTFGITPSRAETGYGYIEVGDPVDGAFAVRRFKEKPEFTEAELLVADGNHLWNSGIFVATAAVLLEEASVHCPDLLNGVKSAMASVDDGVLELGRAFSEVEKISFDHAIMERTDHAVVMPLEVAWDDVGSFDALWAVSTKDERGNVISGGVNAIDVTNSLINATYRKVAVAGLEDVVVVETPEAVLVVSRSRSQLVKHLAEGVGSD